MRNVLFICTGNSARSIMAEAYMNAAGEGRWRAFSAGSQPTGTPNPFAIETLRNHNIPIADGNDAPRSKSWDEFSDAAPNGDPAPPLDVVVTVCDNAAGEVCPLWPTREGERTRKLHWGFPDPAAAQGTDADKRAAFEEIFAEIRMQIDAFLKENA